MKALISGAGIAGLALAQRLQAHGWQVTVVERAAGPRKSGYMIDFFGLGYSAAEIMGLLPQLQQLGYDVHEAAYFDASGRRRSALSLDAFRESTQDRLLSILRSDLERILRDSISDLVDLRYSATIATIDPGPDSVRATLADGSVVEADVLVGADGVHSNVRRLVFGPEDQFRRYLGFHTAAYTVHDAALRQLVGNRACLTDTVDRMMGFYGLRDGRVAAFAVHREPDPTLPGDCRVAIQRAYAGLGWVVPQALANCPGGDEIYYDQVAQIEVPHWSSGRVTLIGDACHAVSLLAGQGASLAVAGAFVLAETLARAHDIESALARYEAQFQPVVTEIQRVARRGMHWFLPESRRQVLIRRLVLNLSGLPWVNRRVGTTLVGKSGATLTELIRVPSGCGAMTGVGSSGPPSRRSPPRDSRSIQTGC